jgi:hypothetical protein
MPVGRSIGKLSAIATRISSTGISKFGYLSVAVAFQPYRLDRMPACATWGFERTKRHRRSFGSDYSYGTGAEHTKGLAGIFVLEDMRKIERENMLKLVLH